MLINVMICWSPLEGETLPATIAKTFVNGHLAFVKRKLLNQRRRKFPVSV